MSDNVDLMVVGMAPGLSAEELCERLVEEFKQPADAFDALLTAATGAGPAYAAQSSVDADTAMEGKRKLESLGLVCNIPGVNDLDAANSASDENASDNTVSDLEQLDSSLQDDSDLENAFEDIDTAFEISDNEESDAEAADDNDVTTEEDDLSFDDLGDLPEPTAESSSEPTDEAEDFSDSLDFGDELESLAVGVPQSSGAENTGAENTEAESAAEELTPADDASDFDTALEDPGAESDSVAEPEIISEPTEEPTAIESLDDIELGDPAVNITENKASAEPAEVPDISAISLSDDNDTPLSKPRSSGNVELDDGGLSLAADDSIAPIKAASNDVPEALANRSSTDETDALGLSLDNDDADSTLDIAPNNASIDSIDIASSADETATDDLLSDFGDDAQSDANADQLDVQEISLDADNGDDDVSPDTLEQSLDALADLTSDADETADAFDRADVATAEDSHSLSDEIGEEEGSEVERFEAESFEAESSETESTDVASDDGDDVSIDAVDNADTESAELNVDAVADSPAPDNSLNTAKGPAKSIAEELIESLGSSDSSAPVSEESSPEVPVSLNQKADVAGAGIVATDSDDEELRKSREQVAVLQEKIEEDLEEEEQVYQEFEQIAKKRTVQKVLGGVAASAAVAAIGGGIYLSGILTATEVPTSQIVVAAEPAQPDREQESLNAALERSATLINPETLSTEELLMTLAQGSGQDTLGDLRRYILGGSARLNASANEDDVPRAGAAIPADSNSMKLLKNRVPHGGDKYFDEWSRREIDLRLYIELVDRLIESGDIVAASELCSRTKDNLFAVMCKQSVARAYKTQGNQAEAEKLLETASRDAYSIAAAPERVVAMADYAYSEHVLGRHEDALDSFLSVSILAASLNRYEYQTIGHAAVSDYQLRAGMQRESRQQLSKSIAAAFDLPANSAARDLALRHIALTEARMGLFDEAIEHTDQIIDPFASVSAYHGIALEYEENQNYVMATEVIQKAFDASAVIEDREKRRQLLSKIKLANSD